LRIPQEVARDELIMLMLTYRKFKKKKKKINHAKLRDEGVEKKTLRDKFVGKFQETGGADFVKAVMARCLAGQWGAAPRVPDGQNQYEYYSGGDLHPPVTLKESTDSMVSRVQRANEKDY
jgi:hypothetical protein